MTTPVRIRKLMPVGGLASAQPEDTLDERQSPRCLNVHFRFGEVRSRPGCEILSGPVTAEDVYFLGSFYSKSEATEWAVMLQRTKMHRLGNSSPGSPMEWHEVLPTAGQTMAYTHRWKHTTGEDLLFFTSGAHVFSWSGVYSDPYKWLDITEGASIWPTDGARTVVKARYLEYFNNRLVVGYTTESGDVDHPVRIRWPEAGDYRLWDDTVGEGAGSMDLHEDGSLPLTGLAGLQDRLIVYKARTIIEVLPTGGLDPVHVALTRSRGVGCAAPHTLASTGMVHFFLAEDQNIYMWDGVRLQSIGDPIWEELRGITDPAGFDSYFGVVSPTRDEYWLIAEDNNVFVYDWRRATWTRDTFPNITALGDVLEVQGDVTWDAATGTWDDGVLLWDDFRGTPNRILYGGRSDGATFKVDEQYIYDYFAVGSIIDRYVETPDYYFSDDSSQLGTLKEVLLTYKFETASPFEVGISLDRGSTWETKNVTPTAAGYSRVNFNRTGNVVRFRFRENDATGQFRWRHLAYEFIPAGPYRPA